MRLGVMARVAMGLGLGLILAWLLHLSLSPGMPAEAVASGQPEALRALARLPDGLPIGRARQVFLLGPGVEPWAELAPLAQLLPGGVLRILRGVPLAQRPEDGDEWPAVGVILPGVELSDLDARERAILLNLLNAWSAGRGLRPEQVVGRGLSFRPGEMRGLLHWLR